MSNKSKVLAVIATGYAEGGLRFERLGIRAYTENRISYAEFLKAREQGLSLHTSKPNHE